MAHDTDFDVAPEFEVKFGAFKLTKTAAIPLREQTFEEYIASYKWVADVRKGCQFWIGDVLVCGEATFGEAHAAAIDYTDYTAETLDNLKYVARNVLASRRRDDVSFGHHQAVAPLEPDEQVEWLATAAAERLSVMQLRSRIKDAAAKAAHVESAPAPTIAVRVNVPDVAVEPVKTVMVSTSSERRTPTSVPVYVQQDPTPPAVFDIEAFRGQVHHLVEHLARECGAENLWYLEEILRLEANRLEALREARAS